MHGGMDRNNLGLAAKLLAKAQDTAFDPEAAALAEKAYLLLAEFLNGLEGGDAGVGGTTRRERRRLHDRRIPRRMFGRRPPAANADPAATYRAEDRENREPRDHGGGDIDLRA